MLAASTAANVGTVTLIATILLVAIIGAVLVCCAAVGIIKGVLGPPDDDDGLDDLHRITRTRW